MNQKIVIKRLWKYVSRYKANLFGAIVFSFLSVILTLYTPILIGEAVDCIVRAGYVDFNSLWQVMCKLAFVAAATAFFQWIVSLCNNKVTYNTVRDIRKDAFARLVHLPLKTIDRRSHGEYISLIINDVDQLSDGLLMGFTQLFTGLVTILGTLVFMLSIDAAITILVVVITPVSLFVASFIAKKTYHMFRLQSEARGEITGFVEEMVGNQKVVKAFKHEKESQKEFEKLNDTLGRYSLRAIFFSSITNPATRFVNSLVYTGAGVLGAVMAMNGQISVGQLSSILTYANQYTKPFNEISGVITELQNAFASAGRVFSLMNQKPEEADNEHCLILTKENTEGTVSLEQVSFSYTGEAKWMDNLNLHVHPGQRIAIVGPTGCGKTTLIHLLMRFYEASGGDIKVDGSSIQNISRSSLRRAYGMVLQDTWLKSATVAENISYGKPGASTEEIEAAAKAAHAHHFIKRLPEGYQTILSESGGTLSSGQKQLLCIARVMLSLPPMLLLDEATSSLDTRTEIRIQKAFQKMLAGRTSFIVAHRLSTIQEADCILVMKDGNIIEQGTHEELLAREGFYSTMFQSQFSNT